MQSESCEVGLMDRLSSLMVERSFGNSQALD